MNPKQKKPAHAPSKNGLVNKPTKMKKQAAQKPDPNEQVEIVIFPKGMKHVRKLAHDVHASHAGNLRQFSNTEESFDDRDHHLFDRLSELIEKKQHELHTENCKLRGSIEDLLGVVDRHLLTWSRVLLERLQQNSERDGERLRRSVEDRLDVQERNVTARLDKHDHNVAAAMYSLAKTFETALEPAEAGDEEQSFFKLGDRINVFVGAMPIGGSGSFISMNDEVLVWFDSTGHVSIQSLNDSNVSIERA